MLKTLLRVTICLLILSIPATFTTVAAKNVPQADASSVPAPASVLKDFTSDHELQSLVDAWKAKDEGITIICGPDGTVNLDKVCVPAALSLKDYAISQGYYLSLQMLSASDYEYWYQQTANGQGHMVNLAVIGTNIYMIEPSDGHIWLAGLNGSVISN